MLLRTGEPVDLRSTVGVHQHGHHDPTTVVTSSDVWRASRTPDGPGTLHLVREADGLRAEAWGPGAGWLLDGVPDLVGAHDDPRALTPVHDAVADAQHRHPGLRIGRSRRVMPALVAAVLAHRVTSVEALRAWTGICRALGELAPGPVPLVLPPDSVELAGLPYWWFHRFAVERRRADTIRRAAVRADRLEECTAMPLPDAHARLGALPGIGPWTVGTVAGTALGDPDAVVVGDYHLPHLVSWALTGERRGSDERMLELLEPYRGQRWRVVRLLVLSGPMAPRHAPRRAIMPVASL